MLEQVDFIVKNAENNTAAMQDDEAVLLTISFFCVHFCDMPIV